MDPFSLGSLLKNIQAKISSGSVKKKSLATFLSDFLHVTIGPQEISIKNKTLFLSVSPSIKHEVFLQKKSLLEELKKRMFFFDDIR